MRSESIRLRCKTNQSERNERRAKFSSTGALVPLRRSPRHRTRTACESRRSLPSLTTVESAHATPGRNTITSTDIRRTKRSAMSSSSINHHRIDRPPPTFCAAPTHVQHMTSHAASVARRANYANRRSFVNDDSSTRKTKIVITFSRRRNSLRN